MMENDTATARLILSIIGLNDVEDVFDTLNCQDTAETLSFTLWPMTMEQAQICCEESIQGLKTGNDLMYIARDKMTRKAIGYIGIHDIQKNDHITAEIGYWITPSFQGQGYATEMLTAIIDLAFGKLALQSLCATVLPTNVKSRRVLETQGFKITGRKTIDVLRGKVADRDVFELKNNFYSEKK